MLLKQRSKCYDRKRKRTWLAFVRYYGMFNNNVQHIFMNRGEIIMEKSKKQKLEKHGWKVGSVADFLSLTPEEVDLLNRGSNHINKYKGIPDAKIKVRFIDGAYKKGNRK